MPDILITENIKGAAVDAMSSRFEVAVLPDLWKNPAELLQRVNDFRALIIRNQTQVNAALLQAAKKLEVIGRAGVGLNNVDVAAATRAGILVTSTPDQNAISVAELAIGLILSLARMIPAADADTKQGNWNRLRFLGTEIYGKTIGIIGAGKIGYLTARRAQAFGMKVLAYDPFVSKDSILLSELSAELVSLEDLLERSDVVSCHLPATPQTTGLVNAGCFARMKPAATFINTSRGEVVVEGDLLTALKSGAIAGAALDVRASEPPQPGELEKLPNLILMPHVAAFTHEAQDRVTNAICEDVCRVLEGKPAMNAVNEIEDE
ncbi:MAG TPA: hydroxyacid dehydrogenase [Terracidiphilus sp.]|nr:hydroxyacid dehydrogenase [Terracidiphilus sp.]